MNYYIRCTEETHTEIKVAAAKEGMSMQDFAQQLWRDHQAGRDIAGSIHVPTKEGVALVRGAPDNDVLKSIQALQESVTALPAMIAEQTAAMVGKLMESAARKEKRDSKARFNQTQKIKQAREVADRAVGNTQDRERGESGDGKRGKEGEG
jgi:hypothetical protein